MAKLIYQLILWIAALMSTLPILVNATTQLKSVRLLIKWDHQFQFAGYYAAKWQGFYEEAGIQVEILPRPNLDGTFKDLPELMRNRQADFAVGGPDILVHRDKGDKFILLASVFQRSPYSYSVKKTSNIHTLADVYQACIGVSADFGLLEIQTLFRKEGYDISRLNLHEYSFALEDVINDVCEVSVDYRISVEWASKKKSVPIRQFFAESYGVNFYGDILYTHKELVESEPELVERFRKASMRGWEYALNNKAELATQITENLKRILPYDDPLEYNMQTANVIHELANYPIVKVGHSNGDRWKALHQYLKEVDLIKGEFDFDDLHFNFKKLQDEQSNKIARLSFGLLLIVLGLIGVFATNQFLNRRKDLVVFAESERILSTILSEQSDSLWEWSPETRQLRIGRNWILITGEKEQEYYADWSVLEKHVHQDEAIKVKGFIADVEKGVEDASVTFRVMSKKRECYWYLMRVSFIQNAQLGSRVVGVLVDLSEEFRRKVDEDESWSALQNEKRLKKREMELRFNELHESKILLQEILDLTPLSIYWKDSNSVYIGANRRFVNDAGLLSLSELIGKTDFDLPWKESAEAYRSADRLIIEENASLPFFDDTQRRKDGSSVHMRATKVALRNASGDIVGILGMNEDMTLLRKAYHEMRRQKEKTDKVYGRLRSIIDHSPDMIFLKDYSNDEGAYAVCNHYFERWVGLKEPKIVGKTDEKLFGDKVGSLFKEEDRSVLKSGKKINKEVELRLASGKLINFHFTIIPIISLSAESKTILGIGRDITHKKEIEKIYETIFEISYDGYMILDENGAIEKCNQAMLTLLEATEEELIGRYPIKDLSPEFQPDGTSSLMRARELNANVDSDRNKAFNWTHKTLKGKLLTVTVKLSRIVINEKSRMLVQWHNETTPS